jgi:hypothetical protein
MRTPAEKTFQAIRQMCYRSDKFDYKKDPPIFFISEKEGCAIHQGFGFDDPLKRNDTLQALNKQGILCGIIRHYISGEETQTYEWRIEADGTISQGPQWFKDVPLEYEYEIEVNGRKYTVTQDVVFMVELGKGTGAYKPQHTFDDFGQAGHYYRSYNIGNGYKKRLQMKDRGRTTLLARQFS